MATTVTRYRFTVDDYHAMGRAGIFDQDDRVELIDGEIVVMPPVGDWHASNVDRVAEVFGVKAREHAIVRVQNPVQLGLHWAPQPDIVLLRRRRDFYRSATPAAEDVLLAVEVSDTTVQFDRETKVPGYGRAGIPETWLFVAGGEGIEVYREPYEDGYRQVIIARRGETLTPQALPGVSIEVSELLGPDVL